MKYHAFLTYSRRNLKEAEIIYELLHNTGIIIFFDQRCITAGERFQQAIDHALRESEIALVLVGPDGLGPWQEEENYCFQLLEVASRHLRRIIPVLLPGASLDLQSKEAPLFLSRSNYFKFNEGVDDVQDQFRLVSEIMRALPKSKVNIGELERRLLRQEGDTLLRNTIAFYDSEAEIYHHKWKDILPLPPMYAFLTELKARSMSPAVLDAGCGPGHHARFFAQQGCAVTGIDLSAGMIAIANRERVEGTKFILGDMRDLQRLLKGRNLFDGVWACASCLHLTKEAFGWQLYEFAAVLRPAGVLGLSFQVGAPPQLAQEGRFYERYDEDELLRRIETHGFRIVNINTQITGENTLNKRQVKKWMNITAVAPNEKERLGRQDE